MSLCSPGSRTHYVVALVWLHTLGNDPASLSLSGARLIDVSHCAQFMNHF